MAPRPRYPPFRFDGIATPSPLLPSWVVSLSWYEAVKVGKIGAIVKVGGKGKIRGGNNCDDAAPGPPPTKKERMTLQAIRDPAQLQDLAERLLVVDTWSELLGQD